MTTPTSRTEVASEVWSTMWSMVINNERKREVCEETGLSFAKTRALRRIAQCAPSMGELAAVLGMDPPNVTSLVDDLQRAGLVSRRAHDADRRVMLVTATAEGRALAQQVNAILGRPPEGLVNLPVRDLEELRRIFAPFHEVSH